MPTPDITDAELGLMAPRLTTAPTKITLSNTSNVCAGLGAGEYLIVSTVDCFVLQGASTVTSNTACNPLYANKYIPMFVTSQTVDGYLAGIVTSGAGTVDIIKTNP